MSPKCESPVEKTFDEPDKSDDEPQQVESYNENIYKNDKKTFTIVAFLIAVAIVVFFGLKQVANQNRTKDYGVSLDNITYKILYEATNAETYGNLINKVWYNAIYKERDPETDIYQPSWFF